MFKRSNKPIFFTLDKPRYIYCKVFFSQSVRLELFKKLIPFLEEGVDLHSVIKTLGEEYRNQAKDDIGQIITGGYSRALILSELEESMNNAVSFSESLKPWVSNSDYMMISTGEQGGQIVNALTNIIKANEDIARIKGTIKSAMSYPAFLFAILMAIMLMSRYQMIPTLMEMVPLSEWPARSQDFYHFTMGATDYWILAIFGLAAFAKIVGYSFHVWTNPLRKYFDKIPPYTSFKSISSSMFLISLSALLSTGMPAADAIKNMAHYSSAYIKKHLYKSIVLLDNGYNLGMSLDTDFLDPETGMNIRIYAKAADPTKALDRIGSEAIESTISKITAVSSLFRNFIMLAVASYMIWMITAFQAVSQSLQSGVGF